MPAIVNGRQEKACQLLAMGKSKKDAYEGAGYAYAAPSATNFFKKPTIAERVRELMQEKAARDRQISAKASSIAGVDRAWVSERLKYIAEVAIRGAPVRDKKTGQPLLDADGKQVFDGKMQLTAATRALQLLGLDIGMFVQRHELGEPGEFARLSNDELKARMRKDMEALGIDDEAMDALIEQFSEDSLTVGEA